MDVLAGQDLHVRSEDQVFVLVRRAVQDIPDRESRIHIWQQVRFGQLSGSCLCEATQIDDTPREFFTYLAISNAFMPKKALSTVSPPVGFRTLCKEWVTNITFQPRKYLIGIHCASVYSLKKADNEAKDFLRDAFAGRAISEDLTELGCCVTYLNAASALRLNSARDVDVVIVGDLVDEMCASAVHLLAARLTSGLGVVDIDCSESLFISLFPPRSRTLAHSKPILTNDQLRSVPLREVSFEIPEHPIFQLHHSREHELPLLAVSDTLFDSPTNVVDGARILAKSRSGQSVLVESADQRMVSLPWFSPDCNHWSLELRRLLISAIAHVYTTGSNDQE